MWLRDQRPDFELMSDEKYVIKSPANVDRNFTLRTQKDHQTDLHYIGIFVDVVGKKNSIEYVLIFSSIFVVSDWF